MSEFETIEQIAADVAQMYTEDESTWTKGSWALDSDGRYVLPTNSRAVCWCLRGAMEARIPHIWPPFKPFEEFARRDALAKQLYRAFDEALGYTRDPDEVSAEIHFVRWNDEPERKLSEVIGLCQKVAKVGEGFVAFRAAAQ